ncbi:MAG: hypothetical protein ACK5JT_04790 [Hyphomicrobiaceae bacterium]
MSSDDELAALKARAAEMGARIEEQKRRFGGTAVPFGENEWKDIIDTHADIARKINDDRRPDAKAMDRIKGDLKALALSIDGWMKDIDGHYARQQRDKK